MEARFLLNTGDVSAVAVRVLMLKREAGPGGPASQVRRWRWELPDYHLPSSGQPPLPKLVEGQVRVTTPAAFLMSNFVFVEPLDSSVNS